MARVKKSRLGSFIEAINESSSNTTKLYLACLQPCAAKPTNDLWHYHALVVLYIYAGLWKLIDAKLTEDSIVKVVYISIRVFFLLPADLRISDDEQHTFAVGLPRARLRSGIDMELLIGSSGYSHSLHSHGRLR